jgi:hypothetical protein
LDAAVRGLHPNFLFVREFLDIYFKPQVWILREVIEALKVALLVGGKRALGV